MKNTKNNMEKYREKLEYPKIIARLAEYASFAVSREQLEQLEPLPTLQQAKEAMAATTEGVELLRLYPTYSLGPCRDIRDSLRRVELGGTLSVEQLVAVADLCRAARLNKDFFSHVKGHFPQLTELAKGISLFKTIENALDKALTADAQIADAASDRLYGIRRRIRTYERQIQEHLENFIRNPNTSKFLQEPIVTQRAGRFVVPVRQECRSSVAGLVHDVSSSGATLFVEPLAVMQANNELARLHAEEEDEIAAILRALSMLIASNAEDLNYSLNCLARLDFIMAKARLSQDMRAAACQLNDNGLINLKQARHPLIKGHVVPIDLRLEPRLKVMVITGPNTGGKTVTLKTVGLLTLMAEAGLHIPAEPGSSLNFFRQVFADIGDEQSIEQNLSTFSSHMVNTVSILEKADNESLVLFDELGAGTDPVEGAALATAILSELHGRGAVVMATTHYSELKLYALQTADVENACCEFDVTTLRPTYRLLIGVPGKSNAFAISGRLGLSDDIIEDARRRVTSDAQAFEDVISDLEDTRARLEQEHETVSKNRREIDELKRKLREKSEKLDSSRDRILANANAEASKILSEAKEYADETIRKYNKWAKSDRHIREMEEERAKLREQIKDKDSGQPKKDKKKPKAAVRAKDLMIGTDVRIFSLNSVGTVSTLPNEKGELFVQAGLLRTKVKLDDIEIIKKQEPQKDRKHSGGGRIRMDKSMGIHQDVNLIGMTVDEAMPVLAKYLDDAYLAHLERVTVIHGRGTGALRKAVHGHLKKTKYVKSYRLGEFGEGDMGVTVVEFQ